MTLPAQMPASRTHWALPKRDRNVAQGSHAGVEESFGLGKLAFASLWLLVFAIPWEDAITISGFGTSARLVGAVTLVFGILAIIEKGTIRRPAPGHFIMVLFVMSAAASYLWSLYPEGTLVQALTYIQLFVMVWLIWQLAFRVRDQVRLMQAYVFGTLVSGSATVYDFLSHHESVYQRYAGAGLNADDLGLIMALSIPVSYYLLIQSKGPVMWVYRLQLALAGTTILLGAARASFLAALVALLIVPWTCGRLVWRQKIAILLTVVLLVCGALIFVPSTSWDRLATIPDEFTRGTFTGRTVIWKAGWELFREHPFLGVGANAFRLMTSRVLGRPINVADLSATLVAHNTFLSVLVEQGILGFALFCGLIGVLVQSLKVLPPLPQKLWAFSLAVWVVGVSSLTWEIRKPTWFLFGLLMAQCGSMVKEPARAQGTDVCKPRLVPGLQHGYENPLVASS